MRKSSEGRLEIVQGSLFLTKRGENPPASGIRPGRLVSQLNSLVSQFEQPGTESFIRARGRLARRNPSEIRDVVRLQFYRLGDALERLVVVLQFEMGHGAVFVVVPT